MRALAYVLIAVLLVAIGTRVLYIILTFDTCERGCMDNP